MWPKRKIQLVASPATPGIEGIRAVLKGIQVEFSEVEPTVEDLGEAYSKSWIEKPFLEMCKSSEWDTVTELVYWPEELEEDSWRKMALAQGINQQPIQSLIHNLLQDELVLWISEPTVLIEGRPMLGHILEKAGFEPTILWSRAEGQWQCERRHGLHWLLPESWLEGLVDKSTLGRRVLIRENEEKAQTTWVIRETQVDFYRCVESHGYLGHLPRWPEASEEQVACHTIAKCLDLGVSWLDIKLALSSVWENIQKVDNLRWEINDFGWKDGASGETIPTPPIKHLEDWWARRDCLLA